MTPSDKAKIEELLARATGQIPQPDGMVVREGKPVAVTPGELRLACTANPDHPHAAVFVQAVKNLPDDYDRIRVESVDLQALLENREVVTTSHQEEDHVVLRKTLGNVLPPKKPAEAEAPAPVPADPEPEPMPDPE